MNNIHGGDIYTDGILKNRNLLDFSSNINPFGIPQSVIDNVSELWKSAVVYPDYRYRILKQSISKYIKRYYNTEISDENILLGNGATEIIDTLISQIQSISIVAPSFIEYELAAVKHKKQINWVKLYDMKYNYSQIQKSIEYTDSLIIANPNNPSGNLIDIFEFKSILEYCEKNNKIVIVDEAFIEFCSNDKSILKEIENYRCLFVIRAFTKFFGMPGVRLGYCISKNSEYIKKLSDIQLFWNINCFAQYAAINAHNDSKYIEDTKLWIKSEIPYMYKNLSKFEFIERVYDTSCNFILCKLKDITAYELYQQSIEKNLLIRVCDNFRFLENRNIRLAIKDRKSNDILLNIFDGFDRIL